MAVLTYKNAQGNYVALANYNVTPVEPVQTTGDDPNAIMSQDAVTKALALKANSADFYSKTDIDNTFAAKDTVYTKSEIDSKNYISAIPAEYVTETKLTQKGYTTLDGVKNDIQIKPAINDAARNTGHNYVTAWTNIPTNKRLVFLTNATPAGLTLQNNLADGQELHIIVTPHTAERNLIIPNTGFYRTADNSTSYFVKANSYADINIVGDGSVNYIRVI